MTEPVQTAPVAWQARPNPGWHHLWQHWFKYALDGAYQYALSVFDLAGVQAAEDSWTHEPVTWHSGAAVTVHMEGVDVGYVFVLGDAGQPGDKPQAPDAGQVAAAIAAHPQAARDALNAQEETLVLTGCPMCGEADTADEPCACFGIYDN